MSCGEMLFHHT